MQVVRINKCLLGDSLMSAGLRKIKLHPTPRQPCVHPALSVFLKNIHLHLSRICIIVTFRLEPRLISSSKLRSHHGHQDDTNSNYSNVLNVQVLFKLVGMMIDDILKKMKLIPFAKGPFQRAHHLMLTLKETDADMRRGQRLLC